MPHRWSKRIQLEPWRHLELEIRPLPHARDRDGPQRTVFSIREVIRAEGGRRILASTIATEAQALAEIADALNGAMAAIRGDTDLNRLIRGPDETDLQSLLDYISLDGRVCPIPAEWSRVWKIAMGNPDLPNVNDAELAPPLILGAWHTSSDEGKRERLKEHIRWAFDHDVFWQVDQALRELTYEEWVSVAG